MTSITFKALDNYEWEVFVSSKPYRLSLPMDWTCLASGKASHAESPATHASFKRKISLQAGEVMGCYIRGGSESSIILHRNGGECTLENNDLRLEPGCVMKSSLYSCQDDTGLFDFVGSIQYMAEPLPSKKCQIIEL